MFDRLESPYRRNAIFAVLLTSSAVAGVLLSLLIKSKSAPFLSLALASPLFLAVRFCAPWRAACCGASWAGFAVLSAKVVGVAAIGGSSVSSLLLFAVITAFSYAFAQLTRRRGFNPLALAMGWAGVELALSPLHLPNGLLLAGQESALLFAVGKLGGFVFASFLVALVCAMLVALLAEVVICAKGSRVDYSIASQFSRVFELYQGLFARPFVMALAARPPPRNQL